jgi:Ca2+-binding EF-hand superfamily protein
VKTHLILAVVAALVSVPAFAQTEGQRSMASAFDSLDANKDGTISRAEAQPSPVVSQSFAAADANGDGVIAREEFNASFTMRAPESAPSASPVPPANPPPR